MKLPNWFRVLWWLAVSSMVTLYFWWRHADLAAGRAVGADIVAFVVHFNVTEHPTALRPHSNPAKPSRPDLLRTTPWKLAARLTRTGIGGSEPGAAHEGEQWNLQWSQV
jgi:hypothetical protein